MEFHEKLQQLRKQKGLTQDEVAQSLFVSRTAISKWESGRGYPNIDSLRAIAKFYNITIDELLSSAELLSIAEEDTRQKSNHSRDLVFGSLDCSFLMLLFLPFFGQKSANYVQAVSLLSLTGINPYLKVTFFATVSTIIVSGFLTIALQNHQGAFWTSHKRKLSLLFNMASTFLFIISSQPYAVIFTAISLAIKVSLLIKKP